MEAAAATAIAARSGLHAAGGTFATKLANAAPFQFTFAGRPGADPAYNESERMLGKTAMPGGSGSGSPAWRAPECSQT